MSDEYYFLRKYRESIVNFFEDKVKRNVGPTGDIYDTIAHDLAKKLPYSEEIDNAHRFLAHAVMSSLWCGWFAKARSVSDPVNFNSEYIEKSKEVIDEAYKEGSNYAEKRK
jgi:hypothetical protein